MDDDQGSGRRDFLKCMAWAGTGALFAFNGGIGSSVSLDNAIAAPLGRSSTQPFTFVQLSDSHIGFNKPPNSDARATFGEAIAKVKALPVQPDFIIHTGDVSQFARDGEFDDAEQMLKAAGLPVFYVPGEHDMLDPDGGKAFLNRFGKGSVGAGWYSFDHRGVHFVALVDVDRGVRAHPLVDGLCRLGLGHGRLSRGPEAPRAVRLGYDPQRTHPPDYAESGRPHCLSHGPFDRLPAARAGHGTVAGPAQGPGRSASRDARHHRRRVRARTGSHRADRFHPRRLKGRHMSRGFRILTFQTAIFVTGALMLSTLSAMSRAAPAPRAATVEIGNFTFQSPVLTVKPGTTVTWTNGDDIPHTVVANNGAFKSKVLDTGDRFSVTFAKAGQFGYFCSLHPHMTGTIIVK